MPRSELQSWEMPFDEAASKQLVEHIDGVPQGRWELHAVLCDPRSLERGWKGKKIASYISIERREDAGLVVCESDCHFPVQYRHMVAGNELGALVDAWEHNNLARLFWLNEQGQLRRKGEVANESLVITATGFGEWRSYERLVQRSAFRWSTPLTSTEFADTSALELWEQVQQSLAEPSSEAAFAHRFLSSGEAERRALVFKWKRGDEKEFLELLRSALIRHDMWKELLMIEGVSHEDELTLRIGLMGDVELESTWAVYEVEETHPIRDDVQIIREWFGPRNSYADSNICVRDWMVEQKFEATASRPTAHEQLEAALRWGEWLASTKNG